MHTVRKIAAATALVCASTVGTTAAPAQAAGGACQYIGSVDYYGQVGEPLVIDLTVHRTLREYRCRIDGMRIYKSRASNTAEINYLLGWTKHYAKRHQETAFCWLPNQHGYMVDRSYYFFRFMKHLTWAERDARYDSWLREYAMLHNCRIYK